MFKYIYIYIFKCIYIYIYKCILIYIYMGNPHILGYPHWKAPSVKHDSVGRSWSRSVVASKPCQGWRLGTSEDIGGHRLAKFGLTRNLGIRRIMDFPVEVANWYQFMKYEWLV